MKLTVCYFAAFREAVGLERETLDSQAGTPRELFVEAMQRHAALEHEPAALVAINDAMAGWEDRLNEGDEVLFFPPVAGG